jgi:hypothetical protein
MPQSIDQKRFSAAMRTVNYWSCYPLENIPKGTRIQVLDTMRKLPEHLQQEVNDRLEEIYGNNARKY